MKIIRMVLLALTLTYSVAKADVVLVPDFRVDQDPTPNSNQFAGLASSLTYGYFVVTYAYTGNNYTLMARRFSLNGTALGNAFIINSTPSSAGAAGPTVAIDSNGNMIFTWTDNRTGQSHIYYKMFDKDENPLNADTIVDQGPRGVVSSISAIAAGGFVIGWTDSRGVGYSIYARIYNSAGVPLGNDFRVDQNPDVDSNFGWTSITVIATSAIGKVYFAWVDQRDYGLPLFYSAVYARVFDSSGNPLGNDFRVDQGNDSVWPMIASTPDGNFIVAWEDYRQEGYFGSPDVYARAFDPNGTPFGNDFIVNESNSAGIPSISCAPSGRCLVIFNKVVGRPMSSSGTLLDSQFIITTSAGGGFGSIYNAPVGNNQFVTIWPRDPNQVWATITGPDPRTGIASLSPLTLVLLTISFMAILVLFLRKRLGVVAMLLLGVLLFTPSSSKAGTFPYVCNPDTAVNPCGCNTTPVADIPFTSTLLHGDESKSGNRINVYFVGEGFSTPKEMQIYGESRDGESRKVGTVTSYGVT